MDNNIINNNNNLYETKCNFHLNEEIELICMDCMIPICKLCMVSGGNHQGHKIDLISLHNSTLIFNQFKLKHIKDLKQCLNSDKVIQDESNEILNKIEKQHLLDLQYVSNEFNELHRVLDAMDKDIKRQLITCFDNNNDVSIKIKSILEQNRKSIESILNKHKDSINTFDIYQIFNYNKQLNLQLLKYSQLSQILLNSLKGNQNHKILYEFREIAIINSMDTIKDSIKDSFKIESIPFINPVPNIIENKV